jgi:hypothetical protein
MLQSGCAKRRAICHRLIQDWYICLASAEARESGVGLCSIAAAADQLPKSGVRIGWMARSGRICDNASEQCAKPAAVCTIFTQGA